MWGGWRHEHQRAPADLARFRAGQHLAPPLDDDVDLLLRRVGVQRLLAARLALHPGDAELARAELPRGQQQAGHLATAALVTGLSASVWTSMATSQAGASGVAVFGRGVGTVGDIVDVTGHRPGQHVIQVGVALDEARDVPGGEPGEVLPDQDLGVASSARADPDGGNGQRLGYPGAEAGGNGL
jgi:hypothetical protein